MEARDDAMIDAASALALWLKAGRAQKKLSIEDVAKITKIQPRILDKLERGELDGLPAEVFVKGFVRSFAKCVGLDEQEALVRYGACKSNDAAATPVAKALVESMGLPRKAQGTPAKPTPVVAMAAAQLLEPAVEVNVEIAPAIEAPNELARASHDVIDSAPIAIAPIELPVETPVVETPVVVEAAPVEQPKKKKGGRKKNPTNTAPRSKRKKGAQAIVAAPDSNEVAPPANGIGLAASSEVDEQAHTSQLVKISLDDVPADAAEVVVETKSDAIIDAKTDDAIIAASITTETSDGAIDLPRLAEGSQRISSSKIEVVDLLSASRRDAARSGEAGPCEAAMLESLETTDSTAGEIDTNEPQMSGSWQPTMPPIATTPSVPWRRPHITASRAYVVPSLVIDDSDPDSADRERENRGGREQSRLSFLPPILLDREDRSARQGGLTLAVIILLIAATLTLSYLMRRPSSSGDGVTMTDGRATTTQLLS